MSGEKVDYQREQSQSERQAVGEFTDRMFPAVSTSEQASAPVEPVDWILPGLASRPRPGTQKQSAERKEAAQPDPGVDGFFQAMFGQPSAQKEDSVRQAMADWWNRDPAGFKQMLKEAVSEAVAGMLHELEAMTRELQSGAGSKGAPAPSAKEREFFEQAERSIEALRKRGRL